MSNDYKIAFDSTDNLCVLEISTLKYYYVAWATVVADGGYISFTTDNSVSHDIVSQTSTLHYYSYSNIGTSGDIQLKFITNLGDITLPKVLLANLLDFYVADASLATDALRVTELQNRVKFANEAK